MTQRACVRVCVCVSDLVGVPDVEWLTGGCDMSHNALVPVEADAAAGRLFQRGALRHVEQSAHQELPVGGVLAHQEERVAVGLDQLVDVQEDAVAQRRYVQVAGHVTHQLQQTGTPVAPATAS